MRNLKKISIEELETLRGGFTDSNMVISEEESSNEGDGALFKCCNASKDKDQKIEEVKSN